MKLFDITAILPRSFDTPQEWKLEVTAADHKAAADAVFHLSNAPSEILSKNELETLRKFPRAKVRSLSIGDLLVIREIVPARSAPVQVASVARIGFTFY